MYIKKNIGVITRSVSLSILVLCLFSGMAHARGSFPEFRSAGTCTLPDGSVDPNAKITAVLRKSQGIWQFSIETIGTNASDSWLITYTKNGVHGASTWIDVTSGWSQVLYNVTSEKGLIEFVATSTKVSQAGDPISDTCNAKISMKF